MSSVQEPHLHLEVGHILFLDIVGYSKLLADDQKALVQELNQIVRETEQFRAAEAEGKLTRLPTGDGMVLVFANTQLLHTIPFPVVPDLARLMATSSSIQCGTRCVATRVSRKSSRPSRQNELIQARLFCLIGAYQVIIIGPP
jgi:hypothetical protein